MNQQIRANGRGGGGTNGAGGRSLITRTRHESGPTLTPHVTAVFAQQYASHLECSTLHFGMPTCSEQSKAFSLDAHTDALGNPICSGNVGWALVRTSQKLTLNHLD